MLWYQHINALGPYIVPIWHQMIEPKYGGIEYDHHLCDALEPYSIEFILHWDMVIDFLLPNEESV